MSPFSTIDKLPANAANLRRLFWLRNVVIAGQILAIAFVITMTHLQLRGVEHVEIDVLNFPIIIGTLQDQLPLSAIGVIILSLAVFNAITWLRLRLGRNVTQAEFSVHLLVDVAALTALLYFTGGATNPFASLFLLPVTIAAAVLPASYTWVLAVATIGSYSLLMTDFVPLPHSHAVAHDFYLHILGSWLGYVLIAALIAYFVVGMGNTLRRQERLLARAREQAIKNEQLVALGTLAASTAHELGTPLGTLSLLVSELEQEAVEDSPILTRNAPALRAQVERCKEALSVLSASAGGISLAGGHMMKVDDYLARLLSDWRDRRPAANVHTTWCGSDPAPMILAERTLSQALTSILDNAADASPEHVEWIVTWSQEELTMQVRDRGPGLGAHAQRYIGKRPYSDKRHGLGLGLFLSHSIIDRFGGRVTLRDRKRGGLDTYIWLPLKLMVAPAQA